MLRAWQNYRYGPNHDFDPNEPVKPSDNFEKGFMAGRASMRDDVEAWLYHYLNDTCYLSVDVIGIEELIRTLPI